ncbi:FAD:protein FMN transferase [Microbacterium sp. CJ88]|uniref:FAD:protein FMN transferase n=1 Tax=Microbacterium sp. CJ88 TaxID=3445672 RepID=UPI003F6604A6
MPAREVWRFDAIGTVWEIETDTALPDGVREDVRALVAAFDLAWSRFRADSAVSALAGGAASVPAPPDAGPMLDAFAALSAATGGAVNPLVGGSLESLGYDASYTLAGGDPRPAPDDWRSLLSWTDGMLSLTAPATIDVGALGKGRLVDRVLAVVSRHVDGDIVVDASGDLAVRGTPVRIGLEHPYDRRRAIGVWEVSDAALCASAVNRRAWVDAAGDGLHHVLDARTGLPVRAVAATWAVAPDAMRADAVATALFFDGGPEIAAEWGVSWVRMTTDGRLEWSPESKAELFA